MNDDALTTEELQQRYNAAMDSVHLLEQGNVRNLSDEEWADKVRRNVEHLKIIVAKTDWDGHDLSPFKKAIKDNE